MDISQRGRAVALSFLSPLPELRRWSPATSTSSNLSLPLFPFLVPPHPFLATQPADFSLFIVRIYRVYSAYNRCLPFLPSLSFSLVQLGMKRIFFFFRNLLFYKMKFQIVGIFPSFESSNFGEKEEEKES